MGMRVRVRVAVSVRVIMTVLMVMRVVMILFIRFHRDQVDLPVVDTRRRDNRERETLDLGHRSPENDGFGAHLVRHVDMHRGDDKPDIRVLISFIRSVSCRLWWLKL